MQQRGAGRTAARRGGLTRRIRVAGDLGGETEIVLTHEGFPSAESAAGHAQGWNLCLDQLASLPR